jgi:copper chaperone CopZ
MKLLRNNLLILPALIMLLFCGCGSPKTNQAGVLQKDPSTRVEVKIGGMTCTGCEETIKASVTKLDGVGEVKADYKEGKAVIDYNPGFTDTAKIRLAITQSGYKVTGFRQVSLTDSVK